MNVDYAYSYFLRNGGATIYPVTYSLYDGTGYGVSINEWSSVIPIQILSYKLFRELLEEYSRIAIKKGAFIGVWEDKTTNKIYFDLTFIYEEKNTAFQVARKENQKAIWDFYKNEEIRVV